MKTLTLNDNEKFEIISCECTGDYEENLTITTKSQMLKHIRQEFSDQYAVKKIIVQEDGEKDIIYENYTELSDISVIYDFNIKKNIYKIYLTNPAKEDEKNRNKIISPQEAKIQEDTEMRFLSIVSHEKLCETSFQKTIAELTILIYNLKNNPQYNFEQNDRIVYCCANVIKNNDFKFEQIPKFYNLQQKIYDCIQNDQRIIVGSHRRRTRKMEAGKDWWIV